MDVNTLQNALYTAERLDKMFRENGDILDETARCAAMEVYKDGDKKAQRKLKSVESGLVQLISTQL